MQFCEKLDINARVKTRATNVLHAVIIQNVTLKHTVRNFELNFQFWIFDHKNQRVV